MSSTAYSQRSIRRSVHCEGIGLHTGAQVSLDMMPAPSNHGIQFVRTDVSPQVSIPALSEYVVDTSMATTVGKNGVRIGTVEHVLAALAGLGIDNLRIEVNGPEIPIMDGSAGPFTQLIQSAGVRFLDKFKNFLVIRKSVSVKEGKKEAAFGPSSRFKVECTVDFSHPLISDQSYQFDLSDQAFSKEISRARTFGFLRDVEMLKRGGLAKGGSLDNAIVVDEFSILNPEGLRFPDEFVRHKILDALGDIALLGHPVIGHLKLNRCGHALHHQLVRQVLSDSSHYEIVKAQPREGDPLQFRVPELTASWDPMLA